MMRGFFIILSILVISCKGSNNKDAFYKEQIIGDWENITSQVNGEPVPPPSFYDLGYGFEPNGIFEIKTGFYDDYMRYVGNYSAYYIVHDSLKLTYKSAEDYLVNSKIESISNDTMVLTEGRYKLYFLRKKSDTLNVPDFDGLVITHSGGMIAPSIKNVFIKSDGEVVYDRYDTLHNHKWFSAKISAKELAQIKTRFKKANWPKLKTEYGSPVYDGGDIQVCIIRDKKIVKSVFINPFSQNTLLDWAVIATGNLPDIVKGKQQNFDGQLYMKYLAFKGKDKRLALTEPESYYLSYLLNKASVSTYKFDEVYLLDYNNDTIRKIMTDGRYYKYYNTNGAVKTLDVGYNFTAQSKFVHTFEIPQDE